MLPKWEQSRITIKSINYQSQESPWEVRIDVDGQLKVDIYFPMTISGSFMIDFKCWTLDIGHKVK